MLKAFKIFSYFVLQKINLTFRSNCCKGNNNLIHCHGDTHTAASVTVARVYDAIMKST